MIFPTETAPVAIPVDSGKTFSVLLIGDDILFTHGLPSLLAAEKDIGTVSMLADGIPVLEKSDPRPPDVIILSFSHSGMDGIAAIRRKWPCAGIICLSGNQTTGSAHRALQAGASVYLPQSITPHLLTKALRNLVGGSFKMGSPLREICGYQGLLSLRELQLLRLIGLGLANKQIAVILNIGEETVRTHVRNLLRKFDAPNRTRAFVMALEQGLIALPLSASEALSTIS